MGYYLIIMIIVAMLAIAYAWYISRNFNSIPNDKILLLDTDDDHILSSWYEYNIKQMLSVNVDDNELASRVLHRIYNIEISPDLLIIGSDISLQYLRIKKSNISNKYSPDVDCIFNLRDSIGKNLEIAIIRDSKIRNIIKRVTNTGDITDLYSIVDSGLDIIARDYLKNVLKYRWEKITELNDSNVLNTEGSFLYLKDSIISNVQTATTPYGNRINLLCKNLDFDTLLKRWKLNIVESPIITTNIK